MDARAPIIVCLTGLLAGAACSASIGGGESGSDQADGGPGGGEDGAPQGGDSSDGGVAVNELPPCEAVADDTAQDETTGTCYYYVSAVPLAWSAAQDACVALGGHLAFLESADESVLIGTIAPGEVADVEAGLHDIWVGGTDSPTEGAWHWIDGTQFYDDVAVQGIGYINWRGVEPNNSVGLNPDGENCMLVEGDNNLVDRGPQWDDRSCLVAYPYICEVAQ